MNTKRKKYSSKTGLPPGSLVYVGEHRTDPVTISRIQFSGDHFTEEKITDAKSCSRPESDAYTTWYAVHGVHNIEEAEAIGNEFGMDRLILEDIVNTTGRAKFEDFDNYLFLQTRVLLVDDQRQSLQSEQLSLVLGKNWLLTFHELPADIFEEFRERIRQAKGIIRQRKEDYLFYRLIDIVIDHYFLVTEFLGEEIEVLEKKILYGSDEVTSRDIYSIKKMLGEKNKEIIPVREAISSMIRLDSPLISKDTKKYLRDVYEHLLQIIETFDRQRESITDILNLYLSGLSNRMNEVMKVLTIFASIFIPLTFIAGIYGMNFEMMPELKWKYGYFLTWGVMLAVAVALLIYFRRKKWI